MGGMFSLRLVYTISCLLLLPIFSSATPQLYQFGTLDGLFNSLLEGELSLHQLLEKGNFGIGTLNGLNGEVVILNGVAYQIDGHGQAHIPPMDSLTPFAAVCHFSAEVAKPLPLIPEGLSYSEMLARLDSALPSLNYFYAVRIEGTFAALTTRSVHGHDRPYPGLMQVVEEQSVFTFENITGTLIGFRCPSYVKGINVPGWHFHFIDKARQTGGHVLSLTTSQAIPSAIMLNTWTLTLPMNKDFQEATFGQNQQDLLKVIATE